MTELLCAVIGGLLIVIFAMALKIYYMRRSAKEIVEVFAERLTTDTNTLIDISSRDRIMRKLASSINAQLRLLRKQRRQYLNGDRELKEAVTNISHDLRTPLTAVCGYLDLLEHEEKSDTVARYIDQIRNRSEVLKSLTEELFRYSIIASTPALSIEHVNLCRVLEEALVSFYGAMRQKHIEPEIHIPETAVWKELDTSALSRVFGNIIGNAVKYSDGDFSVVMTEAGNVTFSNTAKELSTVEVGKLFDRFYTVDNARSSTGLGLSIAKLLVERMNGSITAEYREERLVITVVFA